MQATLCQFCEQNLRKYYIGCLHNIYGQIHDHITKLLLKSYCILDDKRSDDACPNRINELNTYLEMISRLQDIDDPIQWSLMDGIMAIADATFVEHNNRYKQDKGREITSARNLIYEIIKDTTPSVNMFDSMSGTAVEKKSGDNIEHVTPQSMFECQRKSSLSNCFHVIDPFNMLYMDEKVNNKRANFPYGTINRCIQSLANNTKEPPVTPIVEFHQCVLPKDLKVVEPLSNVGKFIIGSRLLYKRIVYKGLDNLPNNYERNVLEGAEFEDILNWTYNIQLSEIEIKSIVTYNNLLSDKWNIQYNFFNPIEIKRIFVMPKQQHQCINVGKPICHQCVDVLPITDFMKLIKNILEVLKSQNITLKKINDIILLINEFCTHIGRKTDLLILLEKDIIIDKMIIIKKIISVILSLSFSTEKRGLQFRRASPPPVSPQVTHAPEFLKKETPIPVQPQIISLSSIIQPHVDKPLLSLEIPRKLQIRRPGVAQEAQKVVLQTGGEPTENKQYYQKYLKYKSKYVHLKHSKV